MKYLLVLTFNFIYDIVGVGSCNHDRAPIYFAESINSVAGFWGFKCKEWTEWALGRCQDNQEQAIMGWKATNEYIEIILFGFLLSLACIVEFHFLCKQLDNISIHAFNNALLIQTQLIQNCAILVQMYFCLPT